MLRYLIVSVVSGILFGTLDGVIHANPLAHSLFEIYTPIARTSINALAGIVIDLIYGFAMAGVFLLLFKSLPGTTALSKGVSFAILVWFFRTVMSVASHWIMFTVPIETLLYTLVTELGEMLILGMFYGVSLKPKP